MCDKGKCPLACDPCHTPKLTPQEIPNRFNIGSATRVEWKAFAVPAPGWLIPVTVPLTAKLVGHPAKSFGNLTEATVARPDAVYSQGHGLYLHSAGEWHLSPGVAAVIDVIYLSACGPEAFWANYLDGYSVPVHTQVTAAAAAADLLAANRLRRYALFNNTGGGNVRIRFDGTDPTASVGIQILPGGSYEMAGKTLNRNLVRVIRETVDSTVDVVEGI